MSISDQQIIYKRYDKTRVKRLGDAIMDMIRPIGVIHQHKIVDRLNYQRFENYGCWTIQSIYPAVKKLILDGRLVRFYYRSEPNPSHRTLLMLRPLTSVEMVGLKTSKKNHFIYEYKKGSFVIQSKTLCGLNGVFIKGENNKICSQCENLAESHRI